MEAKVWAGSGIRFVENDGGRAAAGFEGIAEGVCVTRAIAIVSGLPYKKKSISLSLSGKAGRRCRRQSARPLQYKKVSGRPWLQMVSAHEDWIGLQGSPQGK